MKKLNATNSIAILSLGLILSVFVAGCGGGNDTNELKTKNGLLTDAKCKSLSKTDVLYKALKCK